MCAPMQVSCEAYTYHKLTKHAHCHNVQGEALFKPGPALQMFPLYLLAAQANLGLRRAQQCSDALCLAGLLALKEPGLTTSLMRAQVGCACVCEGLPVN